MPTPRDDFTATPQALTRDVTPARGVPYTHVCPIGAFAAVAHACDEIDGGLTLVKVLRHEQRAGRDPRFTQVGVAFAFLKERGVIVPKRGRVHIPANPGGTHLDAMTEFHALYEEGS